jgi:5'-methylthioadenosine phosphorylase
MASVPQVAFGLIGGSGTLGARFPEDAGLPGVSVVERDLVFETPYGPTTKIKLGRIAPSETVDGLERLFLTVRMHGWRPGQPRMVGSQQVFWVFQQAEVKRVISNAGVGSVNPLLDSRDFVAPTDLIDFTSQRSGPLVPGNLVIMRQPICSTIHGQLLQAASGENFPRVIGRGVVAITEGPRFETPAEIRMLGQLGADLVAQSFMPEATFAREIGACYAAACAVVNYAEGVVKDWEHPELKLIYHDYAVPMSRVILRAVAAVPVADDCGCASLRKKSILEWEERPS